MTNRLAAYGALAWVMLFLGWHVLWSLTGLQTPSPADHEGTARTALQVFTIVLFLLVLIGTLLPLALAHSWGPRHMRLTAAWTGCVLLGTRGLAGIVDGLARATGLLPNGLSNQTMEQITGSEDPSFWAVFASSATDVLFLAGSLAFGYAALTHQRQTRRPSDVSPTEATVRSSG
jgi:hypothetical protein